LFTHLKNTPFPRREGITASADLRLQYACINHL